MKREAMPRRILCLILSCLLIIGTVFPVFAAADEMIDAADQLYEKGLFAGSGVLPDGSPNYALDRATKRTEAITLLLSLLGKTKEALSGTWTTPFTDLPEWAKPYVGYAYTNGMTSGISATAFGADDPVTAAQYLTFVLIVLGYQSGTDFVWNKAWELSDSIGLTHGEYNDATNRSFLRGDAVLISYNALSMKEKGKSTTLQDRLIAEGVLKGDSGEISLQLVLAEVTASRKKTMTGAGMFDGADAFLVEDPSASELLTDSEMTDLITQRNRRSSVSREDALYDVDLCFRALHETYGAYFIFGDEKFKAAEENVITWLQTQKTVSVDALREHLRQELSFVRDAHFKIGEGPRSIETQLRYEYYYVKDLFFHQDERGYYTQLNGADWILDGFSDPRVSMQKTLTKEGEIVFAPILFCPAPELKKDAKMTLKNEAGETRSISLNWKQSEAYGSDSYRTPDFKYLKQNSIAYISVRCFDPEYYNTVLPDFADTGTDVKDARVIVFDLRSNGGGSDQVCSTWINNYTSVNPQFPLLFATRISPLPKKYRGFSKTSGWDKHITAGARIPNDIPIIVLMDDQCGSSGESMLLDLMCLDNTLVIGSNSAGYQLCGNTYTYYLPKSGLPVDFGISLNFIRNMENVDFKGHEPDVWCNPKDELEAVWNMISYYGLASESDLAPFKAKFSK